MQPRILISRLSAIGDCIETLPVANALKEKWPECHITWVVDCVANKVLDLCPAIDDIVRLPKGFLKSPSQIWRLRKRLRSNPIDIAIDPQGLTKSALVAKLSGATRRIGFAKPQAREIAPWFYTTRVHATATHLIDKQLQLLSPLEIERPAVNFNICLDESSTLAMDAWLTSISLLGKRAVIMNPGAGWPSKIWPDDRYARVATRIFKELQIPTIVTWAGGLEERMADQICYLAPGIAWKAPATSLHELAALISRSILFVSSDTGPMHLASALRIPCVSLFGPTLPQVCGPYGAMHTSIQQWHQPGSSRQRRAADNHAMRAIAVDHVADACLRHLFG